MQHKTFVKQRVFKKYYLHVKSILLLVFLEYTEKNTAEKNTDAILLENEFSLFRIETLDSENTIYRDINRRIIQLYFCIQGQVEFVFNDRNYKLTLKENKSFIIYNPLVNLPVEFNFTKNSKVIMVYMSVKKLHQLFVENAEQISFLRDRSIYKKFYFEKELTPTLSIIVNQILQYKSKPLQKLYLGSKVRELFALYLGEQENEDEVCPFLSNEENIQKIKKVKDLIIKNMATPPTINELSIEIGLNTHKMTSGFKNIYGNTIYGFLQDYKIDYARKMLQDTDLKINDIAYTIGYSNPSHFIDAFKKKYGITPKKFKMSAK